MYNKLRQYNKMIVELIWFNLFKLITIRDIIDGKIKLKRYIDFHTLQTLMKNLDNISASRDKYGLIIIGRMNRILKILSTKQE